jgi:hypothetical protein
MNELVKAQILPLLPIPGLVALVDEYLGPVRSPRLADGCRRQKDRVEVDIALCTLHDGTWKDVLTLTYVYSSSWRPTDTHVQLECAAGKMAPILASAEAMAAALSQLADGESVANVVGTVTRWRYRSGESKPDDVYVNYARSLFLGTETRRHQMCQRLVAKLRQTEL